MTVFNQTSEQALSYSPPASPGSVYIQFAVYGIATVGVIGIIRGLCLLRDTPNQAMSWARALPLVGRAPFWQGRTWVTYGLAVHVLLAMPERYQDYHAERIEAIREDPKRLCYDEAHRVTKNTSVSGQLEADM